VIFLPLKINAESGGAELRDRADEILADVLSAKGYHPLPRVEAEQAFDYRGGWPPAFNKIQEFAAAWNTNYVAVGSLTRLGNQLSLDVALFDTAAAGAATYYYRTAESLTELPEAVRSVANEILANTGRYFQVASVQVQGNERIDTGAILRKVKTLAGDRYDPARLREDLKAIFAMGYFEDVRINVAETEKGREVIFEVKEKPVISRVLIEGAEEVEESKVREVVTIAPNTILNTEELRESVQKVQMLYREKGFYSTEVETNLTTPAADRIDVHFVIKEGPKVYIKEIDIVGNETFPDKKLRKVLATSEKGFFSWLTESGLLKREILQQDASRIAAFYHNEGFIDANVGEPEVKQEGEWLYITFPVHEGDRYRVGSISIGGDLIDTEENLLSNVTLRKEEFFSRKVLREDVLRLSDLYADQGHAYVEVEPVISKDEDKRTVDVRLEVRKGEIVHINRILIKGNTRTRDKVIRRELAIKEKGILGVSAMRRSHQRLQRLDYFEEVSLVPEPTLDENIVDVLVDVKEKSTGAFSVGAGYSSVDNLMFMAEISQNNFLGKGQRLALQANLSSPATADRP